MKEKKLQFKAVCYLLFSIILLLLGTIYKFLLQSCESNILYFNGCNKKVVITILWVIIVIIICFLSKPLVLLLFHKFEKMKNSKSYAEKTLPKMITVILGLYFIPLPVFMALDCSCYIDYITVLTSILGLNGLFTYFIAENTLKNSRETSAQKSNSVKSDKVLSGFKVVIENSDFNGKRFRIESGILLVANYLGNGSGDNLWFPMNRWYERYGNKKDDYPLFNARVNNWEGNEVWYCQLNDFANYLKQNNEMNEEDTPGK